MKRSGGLFLHFALLIVLGWLTSVTPLIEWLVAFNLIGLGVALIVSGFYSQSKLLEKQNESDRSLASGYIILAGFLVYCAIKTVSKQHDSQKISEEGTSPPSLIIYTKQDDPDDWNQRPFGRSIHACWLFRKRGEIC